MLVAILKNVLWQNQVMTQLDNSSKEMQWRYRYRPFLWSFYLLTCGLLLNLLLWHQVLKASPPESRPSNLKALSPSPSLNDSSNSKPKQSPSPSRSIELKAKLTASSSAAPPTPEKSAEPTPEPTVVETVLEKIIDKVPQVQIPSIKLELK